MAFGVPTASQRRVWWICFNELHFYWTHLEMGNLFLNYYQDPEQLVCLVVCCVFYASFSSWRPESTYLLGSWLRKPSHVYEEPRIHEAVLVQASQESDKHQSCHPFPKSARSLCSFWGNPFEPLRKVTLTACSLMSLSQKFAWSAYWFCKEKHIERHSWCLLNWFSWL